MTDCLHFRRRIGAEPFADDPALAAHAKDCPGCARFQGEMRTLDELLGRALAIDLGKPRLASPLPGVAAGVHAPPPRVPVAAAPQRRWLAIAASLVLGVAIASTLWVSFPEPSLAVEVMDHVMHEPDSWQATEPVDAAALAAVLEPSGIRLDPAFGEVTYALRCRFGGRWVPHLVVRTNSGPVTVLLLTHRSVDTPTRLAEHGFAGMVLPAPRGSIAVVGQGGHSVDLERVAKQVIEAVEWDA